MANILVAFETGEGHTAAIARHIAKVMGEKGYQAEIIDVKHIPFNFLPDKFDAFIFGASIHMNHYPSEIKTFIKTYQYQFENCPSAFFSVCFSAAVSDIEAKARVEHYISTFLQELNWQPRLIASFAGALKYTNYGFFKKNFIQQLSLKSGFGTNTSQDYDYTDWQAVQKFAEDFLSSAALTPAPL